MPKNSSKSQASEASAESKKRFISSAYKTFFIFCSGAEHLAGSLSKKVKDSEFIFPDKNKDGSRFFSDGEVYVKISGLEKIKKGRVIVLQSGMPEPNSSLIEMEMILQILKDNGIRPEIFFTYFPYGRQDKVFEPGETSAAESLIKKLVNYFEVRKIYIIDPHFGERPWLKKYPIVSISAVPLLIKKVKQEWDEDILFLSPDKGGQRRTGIGGLSKERINSFEVHHFSPKMRVSGKKIALVDDIISTGGTLLKCYDALKSAGAKQTVALATHGVLSSGVQKTKKRFKKLYLTNTINQRAANVDIGNLIAEAI